MWQTNLISLMASSAAQHDLPAARQIMQNHLFPRPGKLYADKAYTDAGWARSLKENNALELLTLRKKHKGDALISGDTFSTFVSSIRQPIEYFFYWLNHLTNIQSACMIRSLSGLLLHVFGRISAALVSFCSTFDSQYKISSLMVMLFCVTAPEKGGLHRRQRRNPDL